MQDLNSVSESKLDRNLFPKSVPPSLTADLTPKLAGPLLSLLILTLYTHELDLYGLTTIIGVSSPTSTLQTLASHIHTYLNKCYLYAALTQSCSHQ